MDAPLAQRVRDRPMKGQLTRKAAIDMQLDAGILLERMGFGPKPLIELRAATREGYGFIIPPTLFVRLARLAWKGWQEERSDKVSRKADAACAGSRAEP